MKRSLIPSILIAVSLIILPDTACAEFNKTESPFLKDLEFPAGIDSEYAYFQIDPEIYDGCAGALSSLRVVDANGREIPYQIVTKGKSEKREELSHRLLNNSYVDGEYNSFEIDFGEQRPEANRLTIVTSSKNFTRSVSVEGSNDQTQWNMLVEKAYIFDFSRNIQSRHLQVEFPLSNFRYLRVRISDDGSGRLQIEDAKAYRVATTPAETESWPLQIIEKKENTTNRTTEIVLDARYLGLPINALHLEVSSHNYQRNVQVEASIDHKKWEYLGSGVIFDYDMPAFKKVNTRLSFRQNSGGRYFRITIGNYDDQPIDVSGASGTAVVRRVILPLEGKAPYTVFFGAADAKAPRYDFAHRMQYIQTRTLPRLSLKARVPNPDYIKPVPQTPFSERHPALLWTIMAAVIAVLALLIFSLMKKTPPESGQG